MRFQPIPRPTAPRPGARYLAMATALAASLALGGCGDGAEDDAPPPAPVEATPSPAAEAPADGTSTPERPSSGAPAYADAYPGAEILPAGDAAETDLGGSITFTTSDSPEAVIDFYQARARDGGLSTVSALKQGQTQAYAAVDPEGRGATLQVIAAPAEDDDSQTQVSVTWTAAR